LYGFRLLGLDWHHFHFRKNKKIVYEKILDMKAMLERERIRFQVIVLPVFPDAAGFEKYPIRDMHAEIGLFLEKNGIAYFDLLEAFTESGKPPKFYALDIWHPNTEGHRLIAQESTGAILAPQTRRPRPAIAVSREFGSSPDEFAALQTDRCRSDRCRPW
jgi:hypothetical protein